MNLPYLLSRITRALRAAAADAAYARNRALSLALAYDRHLAEPDAAPADYAEFLLRSSAPPLHEPAAEERLGGLRR
jgi:molybdopterin biosynthesis enzyme